MSDGRRIGYVRVSTTDQSTARQLDGVEVVKTFTDKLSGKSTDRPELAKAIAALLPGDTLVVHSMDRLARNLDDLRRIVRELTDQGIRVEFVKEKLEFTGDDSAMSMMLLSVMGALAEFERALLLERQREGIAQAQKAGKYKGRQPALSEAQATELVERSEAGYKPTALAKRYGISRATVYRYLAEAAPEAGQSPAQE